MNFSRDDVVKLLFGADGVRVSITVGTTSPGTTLRYLLYDAHRMANGIAKIAVAGTTAYTVALIGALLALEVT